MSTSHKITAHLWYDKEAKEAASFYCGLFPGSNVTNVTTLKNTPTGDCDVVSFTLAGLPFVAISAGPIFKFNPSVSFIVNFDPSTDRDAQKKLDIVWGKLAEGGTPLMRSEEHTSELQSPVHLVCRLLLEKKKKKK